MPSVKVAMKVTKRNPSSDSALSLARNSQNVTGDFGETESVQVHLGSVFKKRESLKSRRTRAENLCDTPLCLVDRITSMQNHFGCLRTVPPKARMEISSTWNQ